ncbi:hypothetical protein [Mycolicibacterium wolinskyi]|uniref:hypothetical protein n=1 Tax=Mycolicibacterium wolinskyi TaxID=59750 RepID=UPI000B19C906|nr:hypothetical protein [Mycolicibacterium wolinskyi]
MFWKIFTVGLALAGLGFVGAGAAVADSVARPAPVTTTLALDDDDWGDDGWWDDDGWDD